MGLCGSWQLYKIVLAILLLEFLAIYVCSCVHWLGCLLYKSLATVVFYFLLSLAFHMPLLQSVVCRCPFLRGVLYVLFRRILRVLWRLGLVLCHNLLWRVWGTVEWTGECVVVLAEGLMVSVWFLAVSELFLGSSRFWHVILLGSHVLVVYIWMACIASGHSPGWEGSVQSNIFCRCHCGSGCTVVRLVFCQWLCDAVGRILSLVQGVTVYLGMGFCCFSLGCGRRCLLVY